MNRLHLMLPLVGLNVAVSVLAGLDFPTLSKNKRESGSKHVTHEERQELGDQDQATRTAV